MMADKYILVNGKPSLESDLIKWAKWFEKADQERIIEKTQIQDVEIPTVFLGLDHQFGSGSPLLYETLVFGGILDGEMDRYSTYEGAKMGHRSMVAKVIESRKN